MNITVSSVHFDADKKLLDFIDNRINKLVKFYESILGAEVTLRIEKNQDQANKFAEIRLAIPGNDLFVKKQSKTFEESIDDAVDALRQQIVKHKEKTRGV